MGARTDTFVRADSASALGTPSDGGSAWVALTGTWGISSNQAYETTGNAHGLAYLESSLSDVQVTCKLKAGDDLAVCPAARITDSNNHFVAATSAGSHSITLYRKQAGTFTSLGSYSAGTVVAGDVIEISCVGSTWNVYQNGTLRIGPITDTFNQTATKHGLYGGGSASARVDTFSVAQPPATSYSFSGPSVGGNGKPSTYFTVLPNGATSGTVTVTPGDSGAGGTFTPSTVSWTGGDSSPKTFTYTPASTGAKTLTVSSAGALTDPGNLTYTVSANAAYSSVADGNWSAVATWNGAGPPGNGDTATVNNNVTVDSNVIIGGSPSDQTTLALHISAGSLTVATGISLTVRGNVTQENVGVTLQSGSTLKFDASLASTTTTQYKWIVGASASFSSAIITCNGAANGGDTAGQPTSTTGGNHVTVTSVSSAGHGFFTFGSGSGFDTCNFNATYTDFSYLGTGSSPDSIAPAPHTTAAVINFTYCSFDHCSRVYPAYSLPVGLPVTVQYCKWTNSLGTYDLRFDSSTPTGGTTRIISNNSFNGQLYLSAVSGWTLDYNYYGVASTLLGTGGWVSSTGCFFLQQTGSAFSVPGNLSYWYCYSDGFNHSHLLQIAGNFSASYCVMQHNLGGGSDSEGFEAPNGTGITIDHCIMLPNADGTACVMLSNLDSNAVSINFYHNTYWSTGVDNIMFGEFTTVAGEVANLKSNLAVQLPGAATGYYCNDFGAQGDGSLAGTLDVFAGGGCANNAQYNLGAGGMLKGYANHCSVTPGANDVSLNASGGPNFVDSTRTLEKWSTFMGGPGTKADALARIQANPTLTKTSLIPYIRAGYAPRNTLLRGAAHDGGDIGAVAVPASGKVFRPAGLDGLGSGGPFCGAPMGMGA